MATTLAPLLSGMLLIVGLVTFVIGKRQHERSKPARATIVSVVSRDADWDEATVEFSVDGQAVSATVVAPGEIGLRAQRGQGISIRYDPSIPGSARLDKSLRKLRILGTFLLIVGAIWLAISLAWAN